MVSLILSRVTQRGGCDHRHGKDANRCKFKESLKNKCRLKWWFIISKSTRHNRISTHLTTFFNRLWLTTKAWHKRTICSTKGLYWKEKKWSNYNGLCFYHKMLEKEEQIKHVVENKIIKIRMEIRKIKNKNRKF